MYRHHLPLQLAALLTICLLAACQQSPSPSSQASPPPNATQPAATAAASPAANRAGLPDFTALVKKAGPAVVNISTTSKPAANTASVPQVQGLSPSDPLYQFFRQFIGPQPQAQQTPVQTLGSGFIISKDGYVLTNNHVVANASDIRVRLTNKQEYKAKVIGTDKLTDIALLKIDAHNLPVAAIGNSDQLQVGAWVAAIGEPFGFQNSVTQGIVSAEGRYLPSENYVPFIQTDAPINPGNSGGPLFNLQGQVVGITSQIYSETGGYMGIGFAIPINTAMQVARQLQTQGHVTRGMIGAAIQEISPELAKSFGLPKTNGALVASVKPGSPAAKAGLQSGDVILRFNHQSVTDANTLPGIVAQTKPGTHVPVEIMRKGHTQNMTVTVGQLQPQTARSTSPAGGRHLKLGLAVRPLSPAQMHALGVNHGLLIQGVEGPAAQAGIQSGDVLLAVNNVSITSVQQLTRLLAADKPGQNVALLIMRNGHSIFVPLTLH